MSIIVADTLEKLQQERPSKGKIALVPTMGNLHQGHLELVKLASEQADHVIVSLFVNRLQFGPNEDFDRYPRTLKADCETLASLGHSITVFAPTEQVLYPKPQTFRIQPDPMANLLEGAFRPGFFEGVCTVVMKLFQMVAPHITVFGKKDRQQLTLVRQMIEQFALPIQLIAGETIRDQDFLALSSRNAYLSTDERLQAPQLYEALQAIKEKLALGHRDFQILEEEAMLWLKQRNWAVDYVAIRDEATLTEYPQTPTASAVILGAARLGRTRLIDNLEFTPG